MASEAFNSFDDYRHQTTLKKMAWCGDADGKSELRRLLVAESFYDKLGNMPRENPSKWLVEQILSGRWRSAYYTKVRRLVQGDSPMAILQEGPHVSEPPAPPFGCLEKNQFKAGLPYDVKHPCFTSP